MIIIGHNAIAYPTFVKVENIDSIISTKTGAIVWFDSTKLKSSLSFSLANHCKEYQISYAVIIEDIKNLLIFSSLNAKYIILKPNMKLEKILQMQKIAESYLLDSKILCVIDKDSQIEKFAKNGIDGVIFKQVLCNI